MIRIFALALAAAIAPAGRFAADHPGSDRVRTVDGTALSHASGFWWKDGGASNRETIARDFLARYGEAFGLRPGHELLLTQVSPSGTVGAVRFQRAIDGLPIFEADLVVGIDEKNRVFLVNAGAAGSLPEARHLIERAAAERAALESLAGVEAERAIVRAGWRAFAGTLRPVFQVDLVVGRPAGEFRVYVDGETGRVLFREDLRFSATAPGSVFEVSPVETKASACPVSGGAHTKCATPVGVTFPNLTAATSLTLSGSQTSVFNCKGINQPTTAANVPGSCSPVTAASGSFTFPVDGTFLSLNDDFAAAMAYYHLDRHVSFFKSLDPTIPPTGISGSSGQSRALRGSLPALVNTRQAGAPLDNAFFSGGLDAMIFGQGTDADFAYDATVMYHEFTHGVVFAWGGMFPAIDSLGGLDETGAVNEGTADAMAASETGRSEIGGFIGATSTPAVKALRDMADPNAKRTCQGDGSAVTQFGATGVINGLDGEVHDDGEIWNGFFWEIFDGLRSVNLKACSGACEAGPAIQYKALQLAGGIGAGFAQYAQTMKSAATALFPANPQVATYVDCVARRRALDKCDRTVPVFAGETKLQFVRLRHSPFQMVIEATNSTAGFGICSAKGTATRIHVRQNQPVLLSGVDPTTGAATFTEDDHADFTQSCPTPAAFILGVGKWFMLFESPDALVGGTPGFDIYKVVADPSGITARPTAAAPATCTPPVLPLSLSAPSSTTPPKGTIQLSASGGSGGYVWSVSTNASSASIDAASGLYTAGAVGSVTDVIQLRDSAGTTATHSIAVTAGVSITPASATLNPKATAQFSAVGGSGIGFVFTIQPNKSGGTIDATGAYTAGTTGGVVDTVQVADSLGNTAAAAVTLSSPGGGCSSGPAGATGLLFALFALGAGWRRRAPRRERR